MFTTHQKLILASASPRRQQFLHNLGIQFTVITANIDETPTHKEPPAMFARRMATEKTREVAAANQKSWVIGADTIVTLPDGTILGKPGDEHESMTMLSLLNNTTHRVMTGVCLFCQDQGVESVFIETTEVTFMKIPEEVLRKYVQTGEPLDKAGGYGIQGLGSFLVKSIHGSCTNVIGLPVSRLISELFQHKVIGT